MVFLPQSQKAAVASSLPAPASSPFLYELRVLHGGVFLQVSLRRVGGVSVLVTPQGQEQAAHLFLRQLSS
jgi:hypothetical protein